MHSLRQWLYSCLIVFAILLAAAFGDGHAAEITFQPPFSLKTKNNPEKQHIKFDGYGIEGEIAEGDFEKFEKLVRKYGHAVNTVALASPGGDLVEAMRIGRLIREMRFKTTAPHRMWVSIKARLIFGLDDESNNICASSCFYIYLAGVNRWGTEIGIHRPYLPKHVYAEMDMNEAFEADSYLRKLVIEYFNDMGVPNEYVARSFEVPSGSIVWLDREEVEQRFSGYIPEIDEWVSAQCDAFTKVEQALWDKYLHTTIDGIPSDIRPIHDALYKKFQEIEECKSEKLREASCRAWNSKYNSLDQNPCDSYFGEH